MKDLLRLCPILMFICVSFVRANEPSANPATVGAVAAADDERTAATQAADPARLDAIFSDELRYAHSSGKVDSKSSYTKSLVTHSTVYESFDYKERTFSPIAADVVLMTGRVVIHARDGETKLALDLNFLAVWRNENGKWRFRAWQSCRNQPPPPSACK